MKVAGAPERAGLLNRVEACAISASDTWRDAETPGPDWDPAPVVAGSTAEEDTAGSPRVLECCRTDATFIANSSDLRLHDAYATPAGIGEVPVPVATRMAWSRSAIMSSTCSMPTEIRTSSGVTPLAT